MPEGSERHKHPPRTLLPALTAALAVAFLPPPVPAQEEDIGEITGAYRPLSSEPSLTLGEVVRATAERLPAKGQPQARRNEARALKDRAGAWLPTNPAVELIHYNDAVATSDGNREWEAGVELPLWYPGQKSARQAVARGATAQVRAARRDLRLQAAGVTREALWALALQRNRVALARRELETARVLQDKVQRRLELGDLARTDLLLARERVLQKETKLTEERARLRVLRADYRRLTGLEWVPSEWREERASVRAVPRDHPALVRVERKVERLRAQRELAGEESATNPALLLGSRRERTGNGTTVTSLLASIRVPIGLSTQTRNEQAAVGVEVARAQTRLDRTRRELRRALQAARQHVAAARQTLSQARRRERMARENRDLANKAFEAGEYDLIDLIKVRDKYATARRDRAQRELALERAIARFNQAAGEIPWPSTK